MRRSSVVGVFLLAALLMGSACTDGGTEIVSSGASVRLVEVASGELPITGAVHPVTSEVWIGEQGGSVRLLDESSLSDPILDLSGVTVADGERGLLGLAFSPAGDAIYVHYSNLEGDTTVSEFPLSAAMEVGPERVVLRAAQPYSNHNGGDIVFGPDGYLYIGLGDGGSGGDPDGNGQNRETLLGSILRIDPANSVPYQIPDTNPFAHDADARPEIWAYGVRNPFRFSFDDDGSLWVADVGQNEFEEITRIPPGIAGANLGWNLREGDSEFTGAEPPDHVGPTLVYSHDGRCSVTGGLVYRGAAIEELVGSYLYSDYCDPTIRAFSSTDPSDDRSLGIKTAGATVAFVEDADREVVVLSLDGPIYRLQRS